MIKSLTPARLDGLTKRFFNRPPHYDYAGIKCGSFHAKNISPLCKIHGASLKGYVMVASSVVVLLFFGSPFNIIRKVSTIVVDAFNGMLRCWPRTDVLIKGRERLAPFLEDLNPSTAVIFKSFVSGTVAAFYHSCPRFVFGKAKVSTSFNASTAFYSARTQVSSRPCCGAAARTSTFPTDFPVLVTPNTTDYSEIIKFLSGKINKWWHDNLQAKVASKFMKRQAECLSLSFSGSSPLAAINL